MSAKATLVCGFGILEAEVFVLLDAAKSIEIPACVIFGFNRPDKLRCILNALKAQNVTRLIVFVDGPRSQEESRLVSSCVEFVDEIDWGLVEAHYHTRNRGLSHLWEDLSLVFADNESAIIIEDDCLPMPAFCKTISVVLEKYRNENSVFSISGYQSIHRQFFESDVFSLVSTKRFNCWGWATWRDRWEVVKPLLSNVQALTSRAQPYLNEAGPDIRDMVSGGGDNMSWDLRVLLASLCLGKAHLSPSHGLIRNIGISHGTHSGSTRRQIKLQNRNVYEGQVSQIKWPSSVKPDSRYIAAFDGFVKRGQRKWSRSRKLRRVVEMRLRKAAALFLRRWLPGVWWAIRRRHLAKKRFPEPVLNLWEIGGTCESESRALLSYVTHPFRMSQSDPRYFTHGCILLAHALVQAMNKSGYIVDVVECGDPGVLPSRKYDLFVGHAGVNFEQIAEALGPEVPKIYFATGAYWRYHNAQERRRRLEIKRVKGVMLEPFRMIDAPEEAALRKADAILALGNERTRSTYRKFDQVYMTNGVVSPDPVADGVISRRSIGANRFLYYAGLGCAHKGLGLILEAFAGAEDELWICAHIEDDFEELYQNELGASNVRRVGWVQPRSDEFYRILESCTFALLASCSEGQPHSVLECMQFGLIPVITPMCGIDQDAGVVLIDDCTAAGVDKAINVCRKMPVSERRRLSATAVEWIKNECSEQAFVNRAHEVFEEMGVVSAVGN